MAALEPFGNVAFYGDGVKTVMCTVIRVEVQNPRRSQSEPLHQVMSTDDWHGNGASDTDSDTPSPPSQAGTGAAATSGPMSHIGAAIVAIAASTVRFAIINLKLGDTQSMATLP